MKSGEKVTSTQAINDAAAQAGQRELARLIDRSQTTVWRWLRGVDVEPESVLAIEKATGIPRYKLRPDLYPKEDYQIVCPHCGTAQHIVVRDTATPKSSATA